jgi:hypothetical protein
MQSESLELIVRELESLRQTGAQMANAGDWLNAGAIYT